MDGETQRRIKETVEEILKVVDMAETTEFKVRSMAAKKLGLDLSLPDRKSFVRGVVESFLLSTREGPSREEEEEEEDGAGAAGAGRSRGDPGRAGREEEEEEEEEEEDDEKKRSRGEREYDDEGDLIVCHLSNRRRVTIQDFRGKTLVSIREYYDKGGKQLPSTRGISLTTDQWAAFRDAVPSIENAIKKLQS